MDTLISLRRFPDRPALDLAEAASRSDDWNEPQGAAMCAWYLRQSSPRRAVEIAHACLSRDASSGASGVAGYLRLALAEVARLEGRFGEAQAELDSARRCFSIFDDDRGLSDADWIEASLRNDVGDRGGREMHLRSSLRRAESIGDAERAASSATALAFCDAFEDPAKAEQRWDETVGALLGSSVPALRGWAAFYKTQVFMGRGDFGQALEFAIMQRHAFEECGLACHAIQAASQAASLFTSLGDFDSSLSYLENVLPQARAFGWPQPLGFCLTALSYTLQKLGRHEAALDLADEAVRVLSGFSRSTHYIGALFTLADAAYACDRLDRAHECYLTVASPECPSDFLEHRCYGLLGLARVALRRSEPAIAGQHCREVLRLLGPASDPDLRVEALRLLSQVATSHRAAPGAEGPRAPGHPDADIEPIALLREAISLNESALNGANRHELWSELASHQESGGNADEALGSMKSAMRALLAQKSEAATRQGLALQVRFKTERALAEAELHKTSAAMESARAAELEQLNGQLRVAVDSLRDAQSLLMLRNEQLSQAHAQITDLSLTDPLTGMRNRRFLSQAIGSAVAESLRTHSGADAVHGVDGAAPDRKDIVFFLLDLDHFKHVNDEFGHAAGDAVLVQLGHRLRMVLRDQDFLVRWGGEEFLVAVCGVQRTEGPALAERLRLSVSSSAFEIGAGQSIHKTASIGFASFPVDPLRPQAASWEQAVELADARLYHAKRGGRNRWVGDADALAAPSLQGEPAVQMGDAAG